MDNLPTEIHYAITRQLKDDDLQNYRLVCVRFANIGADELFKTLSFYASSRSVERIKKISFHEQHHKWVRALVWDTNLWDVGAFSFYEYKSYCLDQFGESEVHRAYYERYKKRRKDELGQLHGNLLPNQLRQLLSRFKSLKKMYIMNGRFDCSNHRVHKYDMYPDHHYSQDDFSRGDRLYKRNLENGFVGVKELEYAAIATGHLINKLRVDALDYRFFLPEVFPPLAGHLQNLTSLKLRLSVIREISVYAFANDHYQCSRILKVGNMKVFLSGLPNLHSLTLAFQKRDDDEEDIMAAADLCDVIPVDANWPHLRKLSLSHIDTTGAHLLRILKNHSATLKDLRLESIHLLQGSWMDVFEGLRSSLNLAFASISADLLEEARNGENIWHMDYPDDNLGKALAAYLIYGGQFPLTLNNTFSAMMAAVGGRREQTTDDEE